MSALTTTPDAPSLPLARSPLAAWHVQHGARFDEIDSVFCLIVSTLLGIELEVHNRCATAKKP